MKPIVRAASTGCDTLAHFMWCVTIADKGVDYFLLLGDLTYKIQEWA